MRADKRLFIGNLDFTASANDLIEMFSPYGKVIDTAIIKDRETGNPRGFGFVTMSSIEEAQKAIETLNGIEFMGRKLKVIPANPREEKPKPQQKLTYGNNRTHTQR